MTNRWTAWVGKMYAYCPLKRTMWKLISLAWRTDSSILYESVLHVDILRYVH